MQISDPFSMYFHTGTSVYQTLRVALMDNLWTGLTPSEAHSTPLLQTVAYESAGFTHN